MKTLLWWFILFFATKSLSTEVYVCAWQYDEDGNPIKYSCDLIPDEDEQVKPEFGN